MHKGALLAMSAVMCWAQAQDAKEPAPAAQKRVLLNSGKPITLPFTCGEEDVRALGLTCPPQQPCPVFLELADVESSGSRIFASGNLHTETATVASVLLASDDAGRTWHEPHERIRAAGLDQIQFWDLETGWVSGQTLGAIPRDPFFLLTRDGGKTWHARPVTEEGRPGTIDSFRFDSRNHGMLWLDRGPGAGVGNRYESYETNTGGESWAIRETAGALPKPRFPKTPPAPPPIWRLRADGGSKAYQMETLVSGKWHSVASFAIRAGECREAETVLQEPPPEQPAEAPAPAKPEAPSGPRPQM